MAGEWPEQWTRACLGEVADVNWGDTSVTKASYSETGFRAYSASGPDGFLPYADFERTGVVLSAIGVDCGKTWLAKGKWSCIKNTLRFWATSPDVDTAFLYWLTRDPAVWPKRGSAQPFISQGDARALEVAYPPLPKQRAIAHILGTLDDKIELNRRMSETLEAMARALFKSWFVDFLPVRAKMAAKANDPSLHLPQAEPGTWYVYAIECNDGSLYIGQTEDLRQRWLQHVGGKGASWTKSHLPVQVAYWEKQPSREAAVERENWLKTGFGRKWLKKEVAARTQTGDPV